ncbi:DEAD/DEAH box helicase [Neorhizobium sp. T786]|uniref:DEAD/DEAH box helicase n=1 Tax=Pseudorhizobium xiangyangii TaxID=2883104 RepID=UPI001CFFB9C0|nr:DEAD/DEAH box helicase [Neorhizobium xiangyangii]MCB5201685.1 DEAD/DEAH box helicase [Neorhizobium xiangyangii]
MSFALRPYQADVVTETRDNLRDVQSVLAVMATGGGKTALSGYMSGSASKRNKRVIFGCHRKELIKQTAKTFDKVGIPYGIIAAGFTGDRHQLVQIASIETLRRRLDWYGAPDLYIPDEAHHAGAATWASIIDSYKQKGSRIVGLTATPERLDGTGLGKWFDRMVSGPSTAWLIDQGYLSPYRLFAPSMPDLSGIKKIGGDFNRGELEKRMGGAAVVGDVVKHYRTLAHGRKAMAFCVSIKHSLAVVEQFQNAGYRAAHIDGDSPNRDELIKAFEDGRIEILSSVDLVSEGFDLPAIEVAILLRPTHSLSLFLQQVGRVLRPVYAPGFDLNTQEGRVAAIAAGPKPYALILDHSANTIDREKGGRGHGMPDDERNWTLAGREKKARSGSGEDEEAAVTTRQCPNCFRVHKPGPVCTGCGFEYPSMGRTVKELEGDLQEVERNAATVERKREQAKAQSLDDLVALGKQRGMKNPHGWARNVLAARNQKTQRRYAR